MKGIANFFDDNDAGRLFDNYLKIIIFIRIVARKLNFFFNFIDFKFILNIFNKKISQVKLS